MKENPLLPEIHRLSHGDHVTSLFRDIEEKEAVLLPFLVSSLRMGKKGLFASRG